MYLIILDILKTTDYILYQLKLEERIHKNIKMYISMGSNHTLVN